MGDMKMTVKNKAGFLSMADRLSAIVSDEVETLCNHVEKDLLNRSRKRRRWMLRAISRASSRAGGHLLSKNLAKKAI